MYYPCECEALHPNVLENTSYPVTYWHILKEMGLCLMSKKVEGLSLRDSLSVLFLLTVSCLTDMFILFVF